MKKFKSVLKFLLLAALIISQSGVFLGMAESERSVYYVKKEDATPSNSLRGGGEETEDFSPASLSDAQKELPCASSSDGLVQEDFFVYAIPGESEIPCWYTQTERKDGEMICFQYVDRFGKSHWRAYGGWGMDDGFWYSCDSFGYVTKSNGIVDIETEDMTLAPYRYRSVEPEKDATGAFAWPYEDSHRGCWMKEADMGINYDGSHYDVWRFEDKLDGTDSYWFYGIRENGSDEPGWYECDSSGTVTGSMYLRSDYKANADSYYFDENEIQIEVTTADDSLPLIVDAKQYIVFLTRDPNAEVTGIRSSSGASQTGVWLDDLTTGCGYQAPSVMRIVTVSYRVADETGIKEVSKKFGIQIEHNYGEWKTTKEPTCTEDGISTSTCACGKYKNVKLPALGHSYSDASYVRREPTCTEEGIIAHNCIRGDDYKDISVVPALGHSIDSWTYLYGNCTEGANYQGQCTRCLKYSQEIKITDHQWDEWDWSSAPCTILSNPDDFFVYKKRECRICEAIDTGETIRTPLDHEFGEWTVTRSPSCSKAGLEERFCKYYGPYSGNIHNCRGNETRQLPKTEHTWSESSKTGSVNGYIQTYCDDCGEVVKTTPITYKVRYYTTPDSTDYVEEEHTYGNSFYLPQKNILKWYEEDTGGWQLTWKGSDGTSYQPLGLVKNLTKTQDDIFYMTPVMKGIKVSIHLHKIYSLNPDVTCAGYYYEPMNLPERTRMGYTFLYWSDSWPEEGRRYQTGDQILFYNNKNLYEVWEPNQYKVTFADDTIADILNNGAPEHQKESMSIDYAYNDDNFGNQLTIGSHPQYEEIAVKLDSYKNLPGLTYVGLYTQPNGKGTKVTSRSSLWAEDKMIYPHYVPINYVLIYDEDYKDGTFKTVTKHYYDPIGELPEPERPGYRFMGWFTGKNGTGTRIFAGEKMPAMNTTYYAYWQENAYYIQYALKDDTEISRSHHLYSETAYTESEQKAREVYEKTEPDAFKYNLANWSTNKDGSGSIYTAGSQITKLSSIHDSTVSLYANWKGKPMELHLNPNGDINESSVVQGYYNEPIGELPKPVRPGYTFNGWNTSAENAGITYEEEDPMPFCEAGRLDLYSVWTPNTYRVTLVCNADGFAQNGAPEYVNGKEEFIVEFCDNGAGTALAYGEADRQLSDALETFGHLPGLKFEGFYTEPGGQGDKISKDSSMLPQDVTLYAAYAREEYTVIYDPCFDGGERVVKNSHYYDRFGELPQFQRKGYTFQGWFSEKDGKGWEITSEGRCPAQNISCFAHWVPNTYRVDFEYGSGKGNILEKEIVYGTEYGELPVPDRSPEDFEFYGWYEEKAEPDMIYKGDPIPQKSREITEHKIYDTADNTAAYACYQVKFKEDGIHTNVRPGADDKYGTEDDNHYFDGYDFIPGSRDDVKINAGEDGEYGTEDDFFVDENGREIFPGDDLEFGTEDDYYRKESDGLKVWAGKDCLFDTEDDIFEQRPDTVIPSEDKETSAKTDFSDSENEITTFWILRDGSWYYYNNHGMMLKNKWVPYRERWFWLQNSGRMLSNSWMEQEKRRYLLTDNGAMAQGQWAKKDGKWYYFDAKGMISEEKDDISCNFSVIDGELVFTGPKELVKDGWYEDYYIGQDNIAVTNRWVWNQNDWYYIGTNGKMLRGQWNEVDGLWYYMNPDGTMERTSTVWEGKTYYMDQNGVCHNTGF